MRRLIGLILLVCIVFGLCACGAPASTEDTTETPVETTENPAKAILDGKKILFIGNSHTYVGNVVKQVYNKLPE